MRLTQMALTWITMAFLTVSAAAADKQIKLFDGKTLKGWHGGKEFWSVEDGAIVGRTDGKIPHNTFLISDKKYSDFVLRVKFRMHNHKGNSGIQFRSEERDDFVVAGYQADIADNHFMGILYGERTGRGIIANTDEETKKKIAKAVKKDGWNEYVITATGNHIKQELNGVVTVDYTDTTDKSVSEGIIALQLHRGHDMKISFKDIVLTPLK